MLVINHLHGYLIAYARGGEQTPVDTARKFDIPAFNAGGLKYLHLGFDGRLDGHNYHFPLTNLLPIVYQIGGK